jgi:hypothetical protein
LGLFRIISSPRLSPFPDPPEADVIDSGQRTEIRRQMSEVRLQIVRLRRTFDFIEFGFIVIIVFSSKLLFSMFDKHYTTVFLWCQVNFSRFSKKI